MSLNIPEFMPILSAGAHPAGPQAGACVMEYVSFISGDRWTDSPACTNRALAVTAQRINDSYDDGERHLLLPLIPRLMGTDEGDEDELYRLLARTAVDYVEHLVRSEDQWVADQVKSAWRHIDHENWCGALMHATWAAARSEMDNIAFLSHLIDAYDKATGRTAPATVTEDDLRRCAELTGAKA